MNLGHSLCVSAKSKFLPCCAHGIHKLTSAAHSPLLSALMSTWRYSRKTAYWSTAGPGTRGCSLRITMLLVSAPQRTWPVTAPFTKYDLEQQWTQFHMAPGSHISKRVVHLCTPPSSTVRWHQFVSAVGLQAQVSVSWAASRCLRHLIGSEVIIKKCTNTRAFQSSAALLLINLWKQGTKPPINS